MLLARRQIYLWISHRIYPSFLAFNLLKIIFRRTPSSWQEKEKKKEEPHLDTSITSGLFIQWLYISPCSQWQQTECSLSH